MTDKHGLDNIYNAFSAAAEKYGSRTAIIYLGTRFSYGRVLKLVERFAFSFKGPGD